MRGILLGLSFFTFLLSSIEAQAQQQGVSVSGSIQSDVLIPQSDSETGAEKPSDWALTNSYADVTVQSKYVDAGARLEYLEHPLPGFENDFRGWGLPNIYVKGKYKQVELTVGSLYDQFGSGLIFRSYEERSLGIDNAIFGARVSVRPVEQLSLKALTGRQRRYWRLNDAWITGADAEWTVGPLTLGASFVNKHERQEDIMTDATHRLNLPENVNAFDLRLRLQKGPVSILAEYGHKTQDPSFDNGYIYRRGYAAMLSASYSRRGMSLLLQAKRSDNMSFRSQRSMTGTSSMINHLPAFTMQHTYALAALYPYATNPGGEWAYQAEAAYTFKKHTALGGRHGTTLKAHLSHIHSIATSPRLLNGQAMGSDGYGSPFWQWGDATYYQDLNVQIDKRLSPSLRLNLMYMNQRYNKTAVEGEGGMIHSDIIVAEAKWRVSKRVTLRGEAQYLFTKDDQGDWAFALLELSYAPRWMVTLSDMYNAGDTHLHYYMGSLAYAHRGHRLQLGYGRTRAGYNCSGGVCRYVPATKGLMLSYQANF